MLGAGGPAASDEDLVEAFAALVDIARGHASEVAHAFVSIEPVVGGLTTSHPPVEWPRLGGESPDLVGRVVDELVFEAFPYQILGPGHLRRLRAPTRGAAPTRRAGGAVDRRAGQLVVTPNAHEVKPLYADLGGRRRDPTVQHRARQLLADCLPRDGEGFALIKQRKAQSG